MTLTYDDDAQEGNDPYPALVFDTYLSPPTHSSDRLGVGSLEAWPAAGGGLLIGVAEPALSGAAPRRASVKSIFLRIDPSGDVLLILPYVALEPEAGRCALALVSEALALPEGAIALAVAERAPRPPLVELCPRAERSLKACGAAALALLRMAAAEIWQVALELCAGAHGSVTAKGRSAGYGDLAIDAALQVPVPPEREIRRAI